MPTSGWIRWSRTLVGLSGRRTIEAVIAGKSDAAAMAGLAHRRFVFTQYDGNQSRVAMPASNFVMPTAAYHANAAVPSACSALSISTPIPSPASRRPSTPIKPQPRAGGIADRGRFARRLVRFAHHRRPDHNRRQRAHRRRHVALVRVLGLYNSLTA